MSTPEESTTEENVEFRTNHCNEVEYLNWYIKNFLGGLEGRGELEDTVVVDYSDELSMVCTGTRTSRTTNSREYPS